MVDAPMQDEFSSEIAHWLPHLRRYARALTGNQESGDQYAVATLEALLADGRPADDIDAKTALFRVFHRIWSSSGQQITADAALSDELELKAQARLRALTPNTREALLLNALEGFGFQQIASILEVYDGDVAHLVETGYKDVAQGMRGRVLIIEDEPIIAMDLKDIVEQMGHAVTGTASTRSKAVELAKQDQPDLVLADIQLADGSSGIDAARDIVQQAPGVPVVFITAYPERFLTGDRPEPVFLITKPFEEEHVRTAIGHSLFFSSTAALS